MMTETGIPVRELTRMRLQERQEAEKAIETEGEGIQTVVEGHLEEAAEAVKEVEEKEEAGAEVVEEEEVEEREEAEVEEEVEGVVEGEVEGVTEAEVEEEVEGEVEDNKLMSIPLYMFICVVIECTIFLFYCELWPLSQSVTDHSLD